MNLHQLVFELRQRNVLKVTSIYVVTAAGIVQVLTSIAPFIGIPDTLVTAFILLTIIGFPLVIFLSWKYEMIEEKDVQRPEREHIPSAETWLERINLRMVLILTLAIVGMASLVYSSAHWLKGVINPLSRIEKERIAVLTFENQTGDPSLDPIGTMAAHLITHSLTGLEQLEITTSTLPAASKQIEILMGQFGFSNEFTNASGIDNLIIGRYFLRGDSIAIHSEIVEANNGRLVTSIKEHWAHRSSPQTALKSIGQYILGFWLSKDHPLFSRKLPRADALTEYLKATSLWEKDNERMIAHLNKCIAIDSTFLRAHILLLSMYEQLKKYDLQDSLYRRLEHREFEMDAPERNLFHYFEAKAHGRNRLAYDYYMKEYQLAPKDLFVNSRALILSLNLINDPVRAVAISGQIDESAIDYMECHYCLDRANAYASALIDQQEYRKAIKYLSRVSTDTVDMTLKVLEIRALAALGDINGIITVINEAQSQRFDYTDDLRYLNYEAALNLTLAGNTENAQGFLEPIIASYEEELLTYPPGIEKWKTHSRLGRIYLIAKEYDQAATHLGIFLKHIFQEWQPYEEYFMALYGHAAGRAGNGALARELLAELAATKGKKDYGQTAYYRAQIYTGLGENEAALESLKHAVMEGKSFYHFDFQYDPLLEDLWLDPAFYRIMNMNRI